MVVQEREHVHVVTCFFSRLISMCAYDILQIRYGCTPWLQAWCFTWIHT